MIRNIIFDWSGVINDNVRTTHCAAMAVLEHFGAVGMELDEFKKNWQMPYMKFYNRYLPDLTNDQQRPIYRDAYERCPKPAVYPGMVEFLNRCRNQGVKLFVVSSDAKTHILREIDEYGLKGIFEKVVFEVHEKEEAVREIVGKYGLLSNESIFIGDSDYEIEVGRMVGIQSAGVCWGAYTEERLKAARPDFIFRNINDLNKLIKE